MPLAAIFYEAAAIGTSALFRFLASPTGQKIVLKGSQFLYDNVSGLGNTLASTYNRASQAVKIAGGMLVGTAEASEPVKPAAVPFAISAPIAG